MSKNTFGLSAVALAFALVVPACTAAIDSPDAASSEDEIRASKSLFACKVDNDCVAVPRAQCCPNGFLEAVNVNKVEAYKTANACKNPPSVCPRFIVNDTRVASCNTGTKKCEMVAKPAFGEEGGTCGTIAGIQCHAGLHCALEGNFPDAAGTCAKAPAFGEEGGKCGTIAGIQCKSGLSCKLAGNFPDAAGTCAKAGEKCGSVTCGADEECCNPLSSICVTPGMACAF